MIQIDMPMPENCRMCPACSEYDICLIPVDGKGFGEQNVSEFIESRPEWCPMKEQEAVKPTWNRGNPYCGACGSRIRSGKFCSVCSKPILWGE